MASSSPDAGFNPSSDGEEKLTSETEYSAEEGIYEVDKIVGISKQDGKTVYRVRWKGYGSDDDTWEPRDNLLTCEDMVDEFLAKHKEKKKQKAADRKQHGRQRKTHGAKKRQGPSKALDSSTDSSSSSSYTSSSSSSAASSAGSARSSAGSNDEEESPPKIQRTETKDVEEKMDEGEASKQESPPLELLSGDDRAVLLRDPFWHQLEKGLISFSGDMYSKVKNRRATLDAKKQQQEQEEKEKSKERRHQKKAKKERRGRKPKDHKKDKKSKRKGIDLDLFGSLESATQKSLSMSPSVLDRSQNSANLFRSSSSANSGEILTVAKLEEKSRLSSSPDKVQSPTGSTSPSGSSDSSSSSSSTSSSTVIMSPSGSDGEGGSSSGQPFLTAKLAEASLRDQEESSQESHDVNRSDTSSINRSDTSSINRSDTSSVTHRETGFSIKDLERLSSQGSSKQREEPDGADEKGGQVSNWSIDRVLSTSDQDQSVSAVSSHLQSESNVTMKHGTSAEQKSVPMSPVGQMAPAKVSHVASQQHQMEMVRPPAMNPQQQQQVVSQQQQQLQQQQQFRRASYPGMSPQPHMSPQQLSPQMVSPQQMSPQLVPPQQASPQLVSPYQQMPPQVVAPPQMSPHQQQMSPLQQQMSPTLPYPIQQQQAGVRMMSMNQGQMGMQQQVQPQPQQPMQGMGQGQGYDLQAVQAARLAEQRRRGSKGSPTSEAKKVFFKSSKDQDGKGHKDKGYGVKSHKDKGHSSKSTHKVKDDKKKVANKGKEVEKSKHQHKQTNSTKGKHKDAQTAQTKSNVIVISSDSDEPIVKDPFWEDLYKGTLTFEGDMYSKVKQRRASGHDDVHNSHKGDMCSEVKQRRASGHDDVHNSHKGDMYSKMKQRRASGQDDVHNSHKGDMYSKVKQRRASGQDDVHNSHKGDRGDTCTYSKVKQRKASGHGLDNAKNLQEREKTSASYLMSSLEKLHVSKTGKDGEKQKIRHKHDDKVKGHLERSKVKKSSTKPGSSEFEWEFEQESPDAGYQSPSKEEMEIPAYVSDAQAKSSPAEGKNQVQETLDDKTLVQRALNAKTQVHIAQAQVQETLDDKTLVQRALNAKTQVHIAQVQETLDDKTLVQRALNAKTHVHIAQVQETLDEKTLVQGALNAKTQVHISQAQVQETLDDKTLVQRALNDRTQVHIAQAQVQETLDDKSLVQRALNAKTKVHIAQVQETLDDKTLVQRALNAKTQVHIAQVQETLDDKTLVHRALNAKTQVHISVNDKTQVQGALNDKTKVHKALHDKAKGHGTLSNKLPPRKKPILVVDMFSRVKRRRELSETYRKKDVEKLGKKSVEMLGRHSSSSKMKEKLGKDRYWSVDLQRAVLEGKTHIVRAAFKMNIALNVEQPDSNGATLAMHACSNRQDEILKLLIVQGASVNACSKNGVTPLMYVSEQGFASAAGILMEAGAFVNFKQPGTGDTALIKASRRGHAEVVQVLLDYGANWALANVNNTLAEDFSRLNNHFAVQDILNTYTKRMMGELEVGIKQYMSGTAEMVKLLFPVHCIRVKEACEHNIYLYHDLNQYSYRQGFGNLLFLGHAAMGPSGSNSRLTGPCYVREAFLNGQLLPQLNQGSNFIVSLPLRHGHNLIKIRTVRDPYTNTIILVGGYSMQVMMP